MPTNLSFSENYRPALRAAVLSSLILGVISALVLDGGEAARLTGIALAVFWGTIVVIMLRRPRYPTVGDLALIRIGCLPLIFGFQVAIGIVWHWRGLI
jgi:hypothetical protein